MKYLVDWLLNHFDLRDDSLSSLFKENWIFVTKIDTNIR